MFNHILSREKTHQAEFISYMTISPFKVGDKIRLKQARHTDQYAWVIQAHGERMLLDLVNMEHYGFTMDHTSGYYSFISLYDFWELVSKPNNKSLVI